MKLHAIFKCKSVGTNWYKSDEGYEVTLTFVSLTGESLTGVETFENEPTEEFLKKFTEETIGRYYEKRTNVLNLGSEGRLEPIAPLHVAGLIQAFKAELDAEINNCVEIAEKDLKIFKEKV